jgi:prolyl-tRNA synthetase
LQGDLAKLSAFGEPVRALLDLKPVKSTNKRWGWVKKGAPIVIEVGGRDVAGGNVSVIRRDRLYREDGKLDSAIVARGAFVGEALATLEAVQTALHKDANQRLQAGIRRDVTDLAGLEAFFAEGNRYPGWLEVQWAKPTGAALEPVVAKLKALKLTLRNAPRDAAPADGVCIFTGEKAVERVLVARAY